MIRANHWNVRKENAPHPLYWLLLWWTAVIEMSMFLLANTSNKPRNLLFLSQLEHAVDLQQKSTALWNSITDGAMAQKKQSRLGFQTEKNPTRNREERFILPLDVSAWSLLKLHRFFFPCLRDFWAKAIRPSFRVLLAAKMLLMVPVDWRSRSVPVKTSPRFPCKRYMLSHAEETALG